MSMNSPNNIVSSPLNLATSMNHGNNNQQQNQTQNQNHQSQNLQNQNLQNQNSNNGPAWSVEPTNRSNAALNTSMTGSLNLGSLPDMPNTPTTIGNGFAGLGLNSNGINTGQNGLNGGQNSQQGINGGQNNMNNTNNLPPPGISTNLGPNLQLDNFIAAANGEKLNFQNSVNSNGDGPNPISPSIQTGDIFSNFGNGMNNGFSNGLNSSLNNGLNGGINNGPNNLYFTVI